jgi:hypothetical protein
VFSFRVFFFVFSGVPLMNRELLAFCAVLCSTAALLAQSPDLSKLGPKVGATVPAFSGVDQFGKTQTLASVLGPQGAMLVFYRSADW